MIGLTALRAALAAGAIAPDPVLFRLPGLPIVQQELYRSAAFATIAELPWEHATPAHLFPPAAAFARCIDLRDFAFDPAFRSVAMIDYFLTRLGVTPEGVAAAERRNTWLAEVVKPEPPAGHPSGYVLLCPLASMALRTMPPPIVAAIRTWFAAHSKRPVLVQWQVASLAQLCEQLAAAALVVSTDTAPVHLADAFSVPCLAFFPTHDPEWRVRDYPHCRAVRLEAPALDPAQEFARDAADLAAARAAWFPEGGDLTWLHAALAGALDAAERRP